MNVIQKIGCAGLLASGLLLGLAPAAHAFDTGPHQDLTNEAMRDAGMNDDANRSVQLENWLTDYYSNNEYTVTKDVKHDLEKLHFDNLTSTQQVTHYWGRLTSNMKDAVQGAAREKNPEKILYLLAVSLHAVQDFYTHSNWVETHPATGPEYYNTVTWFDTTQHQGVRSGKYPNSKPINHSEDHGSYFAGLNHDSQTRPEFERSYVFAYAASRQWINQTRLWVSEVDPAMWSAAQNISLSDSDKSALSNGLGAAYRISEWVKNDANNGHWKGYGSGDATLFKGALLAFVATPGGSFVKHFRDDNWFRLLSGGQGDAQNLAVDAPSKSAVPAVAHIDINKKVVLVRTTKVKEVPVRFSISKIDPFGTADFYGLIDIDGMRFVENTYQDNSDVGHPWQTIKFVDDSKGSIPIRIEVWDEDTPLSDDHCDIRDGDGRDQELQFDTNSQMISGTINGVFNNDNKVFREQGKESKRAEIQGFITTRTMSNPRAVRDDTPQSGPNFVVNIDDDGNDGMCGVNDCSLREAINAANANEDESEITFEPRTFAQQKTILLKQGTLPDLVTDMRIEGPTTPGSGVALQNAKGYSPEGVTLRVKAKAATIVHLTFNAALSGVSAIGGNTFVYNCTFNGSYYGVYSESHATVNNCTFFHNHYGVSTGTATATLKADSCTITYDFNGAKVFAGSLHLRNTISVGNTENVNGTIADDGNNILTGSAQDAGLQTVSGHGQLVHNGGPNLTIALVAGGKAVDAGATNLKTDQRGALRPQGDAPDIGAFELTPSAPTTPASPTPTNPSADNS